MKSTVTVYALVAAALLGLNSCAKEEELECPGGCTVVQGRFVTGDGQEPLRGARLNVVWYKGWGFFGRTGARTKRTATTDANGNYTLRYYLTDEELQTGHLTVDFKAPGYYGSNGVYVIAPQKRDTTVTNITYWLPRPAKLACQLTNPTAVQGNDRISVDILFKPGAARNGNQGTVGGFASAALGGASTQDLEVPAQQLLRIKVLRFRGNSYVPFSTTRDSLILAPGETRPYPVTF